MCKSIYWNNHWLFHPATHRLLIQPPLYQTADGFLLSSFPPQGISELCLKMAVLPAHLCYQSTLPPAHWPWPAADLMPRPWCMQEPPISLPALLHYLGYVALPLFPLSVFERNPLQRSKPDTRWDECSVVFPTEAVQFALLISSDQISFVMNKSNLQLLSLEFNQSIFFMSVNKLCQK